jgi:hypothetical protein
MGTHNNSSVIFWAKAHISLIISNRSLKATANQNTDN